MKMVSKVSKTSLQKSQKRRDLTEPSPGILIIAAMWNPAHWDYSRVVDLVQHSFGSILSHSEEFGFIHTAYYEKEMGSGLRKTFLEVEALIERRELIAKKQLAHDLELENLDETGCRTLNLDPMILSLENLVISTSKAFPHRVYIGEGVFGDVGLQRRGGKFEALPWTYPDYLESLDFFEKARVRLLR